MTHLSPELARVNPDEFRGALFHHTANVMPAAIPLWTKYSAPGSFIKPEGFVVDPDRWASINAGEVLVLGAAAMDPATKKKLLFDDKNFTYADELAHRFVHEILHPHASAKAQTAEMGQLVALVVGARTRSDGARGLTTLGGLQHYKRQGLGVQSKEDIVELLTVGLHGADYTRRYLEFLADPAHKAERDHEGLVSIKPQSVRAIGSVISKLVRP